MSEVNPWKDNEEAHEAINMCLVAIGERLNAIEEYLKTISPPQNIKYKPSGQDTYLDMRENYDQIYSRLEALESGLQE